MANPTSNFNWQMPTPTDLVTDLPADFEVFGQAVDTSLADLKGGTSGQVLSKNSNTDMDFVWVTSDDANAIQNAIVDAKGDLIAATAADTPARLAVGTNYGFLQADSSTATGLLWNNAVWTSYTPTITAQFGTITTSSGEGYYTRVGKMCAVYLRANVIAVGTGTGYLAVTLPFTSRGVIETVGIGRETQTNGKALTGTVPAGSNVLAVSYYDNVGGTVNSTRNMLSIVYEVA
jgi:hypothetical protein